MSSTVANDLENKIIQWLNVHGNKIELNISEGSFQQLTPTIYAHTSPGIYISIGFKQPLQPGTVDLEELQQNFNYIALDKLPLLGLDVPSGWKVYPQTPMSSFDEGVRIDAYENHRLHLTISTRFFAIYGNKIEEHPIMDKPAEEGTYLQVRRDIEGFIKVNLPLMIE
ncbi:unnamed protein product [Rotaria magnacalcarata]|uniref:Uncharacterized protein n=1 Tax=Rotaria magnacalcarata TaxID=392030 RepID=A0A816GDB0_9BILA|nr:unnamed protein product [Rotaria magnacalcarata]CAF2162010.1 unnamed protein product [Rotaria magnacalcarata]CAF4632849.1 unnamed protein product [Rotaria magnacalcarata]CAF5132471.1 unnamed protein product [Rotaria magnacalcarata]